MHCKIACNMWPSFVCNNEPGMSPICSCVFAGTCTSFYFFCLGAPGAWSRVPWALGLGGPLSDKHVSISAGLLGVRSEKAQISAHNRGWRNTLPWLVGSSSGPPPSRNSTTIGGGSATAKGSRVQSTLIAECLRDQQANSAWALICRPLWKLQDQPDPRWLQV